MSEQVVADSTILIGLERIQRLGLLPALFGTVLIPPEVERTIRELKQASGK